MLAHHWAKAEDVAQASHYLEQSGTSAWQRGAYQEAARYFRESLALDAGGSVLSSAYHAVFATSPDSPKEDARRPIASAAERGEPAPRPPAASTSRRA